MAFEHEVAAALDISGALRGNTSAAQLAAPAAQTLGGITSCASGLLAVPQPLLDEAAMPLRALLSSWRLCGISQGRLNAEPLPLDAVKVCFNLTNGFEVVSLQLAVGRLVDQSWMNAAMNDQIKLSVMWIMHICLQCRIV